MIHIPLYTIILIINIIVVSCTTTSINTKNDSCIQLYKSTKNKLNKKNYKEAIQNLIQLKQLNLFNPHPQQIHLYLIYAYYKLNDLKSANESAQHFLKLYPNHKNLDYVLYMQGLINMSLDIDNTVPTKYFNIHWKDRNPKHAHTAFQNFKNLIRDYPSSIYTLDAYKRSIFLKNRIAEYELSIIKFYNTKNAYISVIARTEKMLRYFPDTQATYKALYYMHEAYQKINLYDQANNIMKIILSNSNH